MLTTLVAAVCVALVPGAILGFALPPGRYRWAAWAASPALTLGLTTVAMGWLPHLGLPDNALAVLVGELVLAVAIVVVSRSIRRGLPLSGRGDAAGAEASDAPARHARPAAGWDRLAARWHRWRMPPVRPRRTDLIGVAVPSVISVGLGWLLLGRTGVIPGWDAMNHGILVQNILRYDTSNIATVCTTGVFDGSQACSFYPLAGDVVYAQTLQLAGGLFSNILLVWAILISPLAMVAGVYACVRALGGRPVVASCAALGPSLVGPLWLSVSTGRVPEQTAPCVAAGVALLIALAIRGSHPARIGLLAGLAVAGVVMLHTYDVLFVGVLAIGFALTLSGALTRRGIGLGLAVSAGATLLPLVPYMAELLGSRGERTALPAAMPDAYLKALDYWVLWPQRYVLFGYPQPGITNERSISATVALVVVVACLVASPACLFLRQLRWARPWFATAVLFTLIGIWTSVSGWAANAIGGFWYGDRERLRNMFGPVYGILLVAGAVAISIGVQWLLARMRTRTRVVSPTAATAGITALVTAFLIVLAVIPATWRPIRSAIVAASPAGSAYPAAFEWLAAHTAPGRVVAYDRNREMLTWSYANYRTPYLIGMPPVSTADQTNYNQRWDAWNWLVGNPGAPPAGCEVRQFGVQYVVVSKRAIPATRNARYPRASLPSDNRIRLVQSFGPIDIYEVTDIGQACVSAAGK